MGTDRQLVQRHNRGNVPMREIGFALAREIASDLKIVIGFALVREIASDPKIVIASDPKIVIASDIDLSELKIGKLGRSIVVITSMTFATTPKDIRIIIEAGTTISSGTTILAAGILRPARIGGAGRLGVPSPAG